MFRQLHSCYELRWRLRLNGSRCERYRGTHDLIFFSKDRVNFLWKEVKWYQQVFIMYWDCTIFLTLGLCTPWIMKRESYSNQNLINNLTLSMIGTNNETNITLHIQKKNATCVPGHLKSPLGWIWTDTAGQPGSKLTTRAVLIMRIIKLKNSK